MAEMINRSMYTLTDLLHIFYTVFENLTHGDPHLLIFHSPLSLIL